MQLEPLLQSPEQMRDLRAIALKLFPDDPIRADHFLNEALGKLPSKLTSFKGVANQWNYIKITVRNEMINLERQYYGRLRPPRWVCRAGRLMEEVWKLFCKRRRDREEIVFELSNRKPDLILKTIGNVLSRNPDCRSKEILPQKGSLWEEVFRLLCIEQKAPDEIVAELSTCQSSQIEEALDTIMEKDLRCIEARSKPEILKDDFSDLEDRIEGSSSFDDMDKEDPEEIMARKQQGKSWNPLAGLLRTLLSDKYAQTGSPDLRCSGCAGEEEMRSLEKMAELLKTRLTLSDEQILVLKMIYREGKSPKEVARSLKRQERTILGIQNEAVAHIRGVFEGLRLIYRDSASTWAPLERNHHGEAQSS